MWMVLMTFLVSSLVQFLVQLLMRSVVDCLMKCIVEILMKSLMKFAAKSYCLRHRGGLFYGMAVVCYALVVNTTIAIRIWLSSIP